MVAKARGVLAKGRNLVARKITPRSEETRCTSVLGLNRLGRNTEINPKNFRRPITRRNHKEESRLGSAKKKEILARIKGENLPPTRQKTRENPN